MSGGTRLDRLLNLLHAGTTAATRSAAAEQIGEIQKYHPYDLQKLLLRVHEYLRHEKWETRIAAGQAIAAIASKVPQWKPEYNPENKQDVTTNTGCLKFSDVDFSQVLEYGTELLASGGAEYEDNNETLDPSERLEHQKKQLEKRMGVGDFADISDMIDSDDFVVKKKAPSLRESYEEEEAKRKAADVAKILSNSTDNMSARQRNQLKRKAKEIAKTKEQERRLTASSGSLKDSMNSDPKEKRKEFKNVVTEQPQKGDKLVIEAVADNDAMLNSENVWPFHLICAVLLNELFDPWWHVRHGAVVGLREILKIHGTGAGRTADVLPEEQDQQNRAWLQDCCIRFLCIFALDRFGDYVGDQVVVPVRETCAQAFGALTSMMCSEDVLSAFQVLLSLQESTIWEVRHGSLLGLKYLIAVRKDIIETILPMAIEPILRALSDNIDDVRAVASDTLLPVAIEVPRICFTQLPRMLQILWDILLDLDDLTASTNSVMNLLAEFYSIPETAAATFQILPNDIDTDENENPLATLVPRLWPFLLHNIASVRHATLKTLIKLFSIENSSNSWMTNIIPEGLRYVFQTIILETKPEITQTAMEFWKIFISAVDFNISNTISSIETFMNIWLHLISTPPGHSLNPECLIFPEYHSLSLNMEPIEEEIISSGKRKRSKSSTKEEPKPKVQRSTNDNVLDVSSTAQIQSTSTATMRDNGCEALGFLFSCTDTTTLPVSYNLLLQYLSAPVPYCKLAAALVLEAIGTSEATNRKLSQLPEPITICVSDILVNEKLISVRATMATVIVAWKQLPEKLNPIIRSLITGIKKETVQSLQKRYAFALASLSSLVLSRTSCPNEKIIQSICSMIVASHKSILNEEEEEEKTNILSPEQELSCTGAKFTLQSLANVFKDSLFEKLPTLKARLTSIQSFTTEKPQNLVQTLEIFLILLPVVSQGLYDFLIELFPVLFELIQSQSSSIRTAVARCIGMFCKVSTLSCMKLVISDLLPFLNKTDDENSRLGVAEAIHYIIDYLEMSVIPYLVFFIVPTLGRMSDQSIAVRKLVTRSFATLVRLMPLESGVPDPPGFTPEMQEQKIRERKFLEQLLDGSKLDKYELPIPVNAQLRRYQQEGLNWLGFLQKYKLHGILCDDMGLGKTLQTLCIIVSDNFIRKQNYEKTKNPDSVFLPSMVVCPPTVTGHWFHETKKFFEKYATAILYTGTPSERSALREQLQQHDIVILSYDILRNDIQFLEQIYWNYCALDEGHIIRNAKTKITQAAKKIQANHRLILSGTPIQNNVLELWSLFDFLMPGFLGTEKQFNQLYGKPILASRDPKCSQKDQERGTLALEALHRQVLPFLLRRVKEDVLQDLPPKIIQDYYCDLSPLQKQLYEDFSHSPACHSIQSNISDDSADEPAPTKKKKKGTHIFQALQYLRKVCNHPLLVLNQQHPEYTKVMGQLQTSNDSLNAIHHAPKLLALKELLTECGIGGTANTSQDKADLSSLVQHRVLIFAQLKQMLDIVEKDLLKEFFPSVSYLRLDGGVHTNKRHDIVTQFNDDPTIDILLLTTHVGGLGLNLTGADTVIFIEHDWNPMKDLQAMDRAHRLGQTKVVNVYRLITRGTLEEKIMGLQKFKMNIANSVVNQENSSLRTMDTNQLLDLFDLSDSKSASNESSVDEFGNVNTTKKASSTQVVEGLEELWDDSQYSEEYNLDSFVSSLNK